MFEYRNRIVIFLEKGRKFIADYFEAVSYTHLDVYKRQGHYVNRDQLFYMLILDIILLSTSYINAILFSGAVLTVVFTSLVESALLLPVVLLICQWREHLADVFAKRILDDPGKFVRFFERMIREEEKGNGKKIPSNQNSLQRLLRTHPPIHDRIAFLKQ